MPWGGGRCVTGPKAAVWGRSCLHFQPGRAPGLAGLARHHQHRQRGLAHDIVRHAAQQHRLDVRAAPGADHDQPGLVALGHVDQRVSHPVLPFPAHLARGRDTRRGQLRHVAVDQLLRFVRGLGREVCPHEWVTTTPWQTTTSSFVPAAILATVSTARSAGPEPSTPTTIVPNIDCLPSWPPRPAGRTWPPPTGWRVVLAAARGPRRSWPP